MSQYENTNKINRDWEQCRSAFEDLHKNKLITGYYGMALRDTFMEPHISARILSKEQKVQYIQQAENYIAQILTADLDPKFTTILTSSDVGLGLRNVFQKMNITTLGDLVKYNNIEEFTADYQEKIKKISYERSNGSQLSKRIEKQLLSFMKEKNISWGMNTKLSNKIIAENEKTKRLLSLSFDLSTLDNKRAMKEFGIDDTSGVFTKLFDHGIINFQQLLIKYTSLEDIKINGFGKRAKIVLDEYMRNNNLSFGMDLPA